MTVVDALKPYGYGIGIVGLVAMLFLHGAILRPMSWLVYQEI